ncbi:hypothetical protein ACCS91_33750 [Rhizobium ruizarguesonis]|uniref:hypothetical protein n=1 Tax=Rhizobium ruizarguesonis TaxID=2081791 RepID=UPI0016399BD2|nr:hypothetical protein [Rhizobium ruizarguesonis]MBC2806597.1 hypothetical protein [Rhizobium ruizarguesonis]
MKFVIWNMTQRKFVAPPGLKSSYTRDIGKAREFPNRAAAEGECCGDERVREKV